MPSEFTLGQLQDVYESVIGEELDKRNFRKKINSLGILESLPKKTKGDAHRPAQLYKFTSKSPQELNIL
jgi:8-oxo-dGTP diphosphatase